MFGQMRSKPRQCCYCVNQKCQCNCHIKLTKTQKYERRIRRLKEDAWTFGVLGIILAFLIGLVVADHFKGDPMANKVCTVHTCEVGQLECPCTQWELKK